jgi:hypothetical protein
MSSNPSVSLYSELQELIIIFSITLSKDATHTDLPAIYQALKIE